jgi:CRISPR/Cas system Type II protein with McrA/HNH and RuvC-like nuclease domain
MNKQETIDTLVKHISGMIDSWFDINTFQDKIANAIAKTMLDANRKKLGAMLDLITDDEGNILIEELFKNYGMDDNIQIDLTKISSLLPPKVLLITKNDIEELINKTRG